MKTAYILGAGFSRAAGFPLMNDFFFQARNLYARGGLSTEDEKAFEQVFSFVNNYSKAKNYLSFDLFNMEDLFSIIEMRKLIENKDGTNIEDEYLRVLRCVFENQLTSMSGGYVLKHLSEFKRNHNNVHNLRDALMMNRSSDQFTVWDNYLRFIKEIFKIQYFPGAGLFDINSKEQPSSIISLNYDLLVERVIALFLVYNAIEGKPSDISVNYGINDEFLHKITDDSLLYKLQFSTNAGIKISKLHGSLNFKMSPESSREKPLLVPPTWNKQVHPHFVGIWQQATECVRECEKLVFIGFSFPITDQYFKYWLINALVENESLKSVEVVCPDDSGDTEKRYRAFFDQHFSAKVFTYFNMTFKDWMGRR
ncbi:MAG: hypothetical protein K8R90_11235 [Candidatus Cloacimonetes bacterium]|nr:hypothetical protein [Candidatus Cloacimonadota bacterium]